MRLAVDDYGTGHSLLEYLLKLPIDEIKLDRAFSCDLDCDLVQGWHLGRPTSSAAFLTLVATSPARLRS